MSTQVVLGTPVELLQLLAGNLRVEDQLVLEGVKLDERGEVFGCVGVVRGRGEGQVEGEFEGLLPHVGDDTVEQGTGALEAGIGIDLDEPGFELAVDHEIQPKDLEVVHEVPRGDLGEHAADGISAHLLHLRQDHLLEVVLLPRVGEIQIPLELLIGYFVVGLVLVVIREPLLDCVVGEVDFRLEVADVELVGGGADVALLVPVGSRDSEEVGDEHVVSDVEFTVVVEHGSIDVHLYDVGAFGLLLVDAAVEGVAASCGVSLFQEGVQFVDLIDHGNSPALVAVLPWLDDPDIPHLILIGSSFLLFLLLLLDGLLPLPIVLHELAVLWILHALPDVEGQGDVLVDVLADEGVVLPEVVEERLLVAEVEVVDEVVVEGVGLVFRKEGFELFVELIHTGGVVSFFVGLIILFPIALHQLLIGLVQQFVGELLLLRVLQLRKSKFIHRLGLFLNWLLVLLVFQSSLCIHYPLLLLEYLRYLQLRPHEVAVTGAFLNKTPPEPPFDESLDHGSIVATGDIGLPLLGTVADLIVSQVQIEVNVVADHVLPQKFEVALDSLIVDEILLLFQLSLGTLQTFVQIFLGSSEDAFLLLLLAVPVPGREVDDRTRMPKTEL